MAIITNYSTLVQAIKDEAEDDSVEFAEFIPIAIANSEDLLFKELDLPDLEQKSTGAFSINSTSVTKPSGYKFANYFKFYDSVNAKDVILQKKREDFLIDFWPNSNLAGTPKYYSDESSTQFKVVPTPYLAFNYELKYTKQPDKLSSTTTTNYYTNNCPDILFQACMIEMSKFMKAWSQITVWENKYNQLKTAWNIEKQRQRRDDGVVPNNPSSGPNTIKHTGNTGA